MVLELPTTLFDLSQMENNLAKMMIETINNMMIEHQHNCSGSWG